MSGMSTQKLQRELDKRLNPMGWKRIGKDSQDHDVWLGPNDRLMSTSVSPKNPDRAVRTAVGVARRAEALESGVNRQFIQWLLDRYGIGKRDTERVNFTLNEMIPLFEYETGLSQPKGNYTSVGRIDHRLEPVESVQGKATTRWILRGALAVPKPDVNGDTPYALAEGDVGSQACEATLPLKGGGLAVCTRPRGHEGEHIDKMRKTSWTVKAEPTPVAEKIAKAAKIGEQPAAAFVPEAPAPEPQPAPAQTSREEKIAALIRELVGEPDTAREELAMETLTKVVEQLDALTYTVTRLRIEVAETLEVLNASE